MDPELVRDLVPTASGSGAAPRASARTERRRRMLVAPGLQLRSTAVFAALSVLGLVTQYLLVQEALVRLAAQLPSDSERLLAELPNTLSLVLLLSLALVLPLVLMLGVRVTFRVAGPLVRIERHLACFERGEEGGPLQLRKGDELHSLAARVEAALHAGRARERELVGRLRALELDAERAGDEPERRAA